jgi:threonine/homoserine/homoserine lactone efflux protein
MGSYLIKGILIGLLFGMPVGAVGAMTVQRTLSHGIKAGLMTGLGSSVADCVYASIGAFGLTFVSDFLLKYQTAIHTLGGTLLLINGCPSDDTKKRVRYASKTGSGRNKNVPFFLYHRYHQSGSNFNFSVCILLFWDCRED